MATRRVGDLPARQVADRADGPGGHHGVATAGRGGRSRHALVGRQCAVDGAARQRGGHHSAVGEGLQRHFRIAFLVQVEFASGGDKRCLQQANQMHGVLRGAVRVIRHRRAVNAFSRAVIAPWAPPDGRTCGSRI